MCGNARCELSNGSKHDGKQWSSGFVPPLSAVVLSVLAVSSDFANYTGGKNMTWSKSAQIADADFLLISKVQEAVDLQLAPDEIELYVREKATVNSLRQEDKLALPYACITTDPDRAPPALVWQKGTHFVYWMRPMLFPRRLVGVVWDSNGRSTIYYGIGYPR